MENNKHTKQKTGYLKNSVIMLIGVIIIVVINLMVNYFTNEVIYSSSYFTNILIICLLLASVTFYGLFKKNKSIIKAREKLISKSK